MKKNWVVASLLIAITILAVATYYFLSSNPGENKLSMTENTPGVEKVDNNEISAIPTVSTKADVVAKDVVENLDNKDKIDQNGFKTFSNDNHSIKYMGSYGDVDCEELAEKCDFSLTHISESNPVDTEWVYGFRMTVSVANVDNYKEAIVSKFERAEYSDVSAPKNIIIDKEKAEIYSWSSVGPSGSYEGKDIFVMHNDKFYNISYHFHDFNNSDYSSTIQEMLNSFKFSS